MVARFHAIAEQVMAQYTDREIYDNYIDIAQQNDNSFLESIHTKDGELSAATITFEDGSELIITREIVAIIIPREDI